MRRTLHRTRGCSQTKVRSIRCFWVLCRLLGDLLLRPLHTNQAAFYDMASLAPVCQHYQPLCETLASYLAASVFRGSNLLDLQPRL
jgi:hypothetical protein